MVTYHRCRLCNCCITLTQKYFNMGLCQVCENDIPEHIPEEQHYTYLLYKILKKGVK
jgi:hypothetical protein